MSCHVIPSDPIQSNPILSSLTIKVNRQIKGDSPLFDEGSFDHGSGFGTGLGPSGRNPRTYRKGSSTAYFITKSIVMIVIMIVDVEVDVDLSTRFV